jgi:hypothetical protein
MQERETTSEGNAGAGDGEDYDQHLIDTSPRIQIPADSPPPRTFVRASRRLTRVISSHAEQSSGIDTDQGHDQEQVSGEADHHADLNDGAHPQDSYESAWIQITQRPAALDTAAMDNAEARDPRN